MKFLDSASHSNHSASLLRPQRFLFSFLAWVPVCVCLLPNPSVIFPLYLFQLQWNMEHLLLLIPLFQNTTPVSQSTGHQATQPVPITGIRPINNLIQVVYLSFPSLFFISSSWKVILATVSSPWSITWQTDKIWGPGSCHSSVDVWTTALPLKVHTHDWGCMGLILLHSPHCLWSICVEKGGRWLKGKQVCRDKKKGRRYYPWMFLPVSSCRIWIFWLIHCCYFPQTTTSSDRVKIGKYPPRMFPLWNKRHKKLQDDFLLVWWCMERFYTSFNNFGVQTASPSLPCSVSCFWQMRVCSLRLVFHGWLKTGGLQPPRSVLYDSRQCHVLERALTINSIPGFVCYAKGYVVFIVLTDAYSLL